MCFVLTIKQIKYFFSSLSCDKTSFNSWHDSSLLLIGMVPDVYNIPVKFTNPQKQRV